MTLSQEKFNDVVTKALRDLAVDGMMEMIAAVLEGKPPVDKDYEHMLKECPMVLSSIANCLTIIAGTDNETHLALAILSIFQGGYVTGKAVAEVEMLEGMNTNG